MKPFHRPDNPTEASAMKRRSLVLLSALLLPPSVMAGDISISGFGTAGYARSDRPYAYLRYIDDQGTFNRDSVLAVQVDAQIMPAWSATAQLKLAPAVDHDHQWEPTLAWAFVSWRPNNDWLLRLGKIRVPGYLNSENMDVGTTYEYARLPAEVYSVSPTYDFTGVSFNKTFSLEDSELILDGYWGKANTKWRGYFREGVPGLMSAGPQSGPIKITSKGLVLSWHRNDDTYLASLHRAVSHNEDDTRWFDPVFVNLGSGIGYYAFQPGPNVPSTDHLNLSIFNIGADVGLGNGFRLAGEYARRRVTNLQGGLNSTAAYLSLRKRIGQWTPYVFHSRLRSDDRALRIYQAVNGNTVPGFVPGAAFINAAQRALADAFGSYDQRSWAIGTSYALTPTSKIKAEWMRTRVGITSSLVDAPAGSNISRQGINVFSLSYSFTF